LFSLWSHMGVFEKLLRPEGTVFLAVKRREVEALGAPLTIPADVN